MTKIIVSGLVNIETSCKVRKFPIDYYPIDYSFFGVKSAVGGVGMNISKALKTLGDDVRLVTCLPNELDMEAKNILAELEKQQIDVNVSYCLKETPTSVVLYDEQGRRQIYCDLKDLQEKRISAADVEFDSADALIICNSNFNRELLQACRAKGKTIITDVHVLSNIDDEYNKEFLANADILFLSDECVGDNKKDFMFRLYGKYRNKIIVMGCGKDGALILDNGNINHVPAVDLVPVVNTVGAGDSLLSCFVHFYIGGYDSLTSLKLACTFAGYKIGTNGASNGFISHDEVLKVASV
jgi:ribokinase